MKTCILGVLTVLTICLTTLSAGSSVTEDRCILMSKSIAMFREKQNYEQTRHAKLDSLGINSRFYLETISFLESRGNYTITNRFGMMGKYQFSPRTVKGLVKAGYLELTPYEIYNFIDIPSAQERAMDALMHANSDYLTIHGMNKYLGKRVGGVKITKEGLLAASHLVGAYAVVHYCKTGSLKPVTLKSGLVVRKHDGNGVYLTEYMKKFSQVNV